MLCINGDYEPLLIIDYYTRYTIKKWVNKTYCQY